MQYDGKVSVEAAEDIEGGRLVKLNGSQQLEKTTSSTDEPFGITSGPVSQGDKGTVITDKPAEVKFSASATLGDYLEPASDGRLKPHDTGNKVAKLIYCSAGTSVVQNEEARVRQLGDRTETS